jgi:hypothetical protein
LQLDAMPYREEITSIGVWRYAVHCGDMHSSEEICVSVRRYRYALNSKEICIEIKTKVPCGNGTSLHCAMKRFW